MRKTRIIFIVLFFVACIIPTAFMPFVSVNETAESRKLSEMPSFLTEDGKPNLDWSVQFETYLSEHFAFRQNLVTLDSLVKSNVFKVSSNEKVITGKNGWLYFASTLDDYLSRNTMSQRGINNTAKTLSLIQEYVESCDAEFVFICSPNKNTIYPQNMPDRYIPTGDASNLSNLYEAMKLYSVNYIDLKALFLAQDKTLYLSRDSHWNNEGALLVTNSLLDYFDVEHDDFSAVPHHSQLCWEGDLDSMIFPVMHNLCEQEIYDYTPSFNYISNFKTEDDMTIKTIKEGKTARMLMFRDSFGRSLYPFISENIYKAEFSRETPYRLSLMKDIDAQFVVIEIVERNIPNITKAAPAVPALARPLDVSARVVKSSLNKCYVTEKSGMTKIYGLLDEQYFDDTSDIYITLESSSIFCYEAFPVCETELLNIDNSDYGFSLFVDTNVLPADIYKVNAYIKNNDDFICTDELLTLDLLS